MRSIQDTGRDPHGKLENLEMSENEIDKFSTSRISAPGVLSHNC